MRAVALPDGHEPVPEGAERGAEGRTPGKRREDDGRTQGHRRELRNVRGELLVVGRL